MMMAYFFISNGDSLNLGWIEEVAQNFVPMHTTFQVSAEA